MSLKKNVLAGAVAAGLLFSASASAQVVLGTDPARVYAQELTKPFNITDAADDAVATLGYNFSAGEVRYGRFECSSNLLINAPTVTSSDTTRIVVGSVNGAGTPALFFSLTAQDPLPVPTATAAVTLTVDADNRLLNNDPVNCTFSIYDQPSQAQAGGPAGQIHTTGPQPFIVSQPSFSFVGRDAEAIAEVESPAGAYYQFVGPNLAAIFGGMNLNALTYGTAPGVAPRLEDGTPIALVDLFTSASEFAVEGDFSAAAGVSHATLGPVAAADLTDTSATWDWNPVVAFAGAAGDVTYLATGADAIVESDYTASFNPVLNTTLANNVNAATPRWTVAAVNDVDAGEISRNGTQLQAPLVQNPNAARYKSRVVLTNTGSRDRTYSIAAQGEASATVSTTPVTGTIPANSTVVVDLHDAAFWSQFTTANRMTLNVTVAAPNKEIQGLYQIVDAIEGGISNHVMVRPGSN